MSCRKLEAWVPSLIPHSSLLDTCRQQPSLVSSTFSISLKSVLCCLFTHYCHFLTQDSISSFLDYLVTSHSHMWIHTCGHIRRAFLLLPTHTQTQKPKPTVKVVGGTVQNSLSGMFPCPVFSTDHIYWVFAVWKSHYIMRTEEVVISAYRSLR